MKALVAVVAGLVILAGAGAQDSDVAIKKDMELLKGTWKFDGLETEEGKKDDLKDATLSFNADKIEFKKGEEAKKVTYTLNPAGKPKEINITADDKEMQGIYKLDKDSLTICICTQPNQARPNEFAAKNPYVIVTLKRVKE